ncbi:MAG: hypothetical protein H6717_10270 [Polyangiaceae bacterium]|nr:hypothetical protein [Polyangiaceae bacterium]
MPSSSCAVKAVSAALGVALAVIFTGAAGLADPETQAGAHGDLSGERFGRRAALRVRAQRSALICAASAKQAVRAIPEDCAPQRRLR